MGFYNYTVILTYLSLISALFGTHLAFKGNFSGALICLLLSGAFDSFDGMVARTKKDRTEEEKKFGIQIDSLADMFSFGIFPAIIGYTMMDSIVCGVTYGFLFLRYMLYVLLVDWDILMWLKKCDKKKPQKKENTIRVYLLQVQH